MTSSMLRTTCRNAQANFRALHTKVAVERQTLILCDETGEPVVWVSLSDFLETSYRWPSCEEILAELLA